MVDNLVPTALVLIHLTSSYGPQNGSAGFNSAVDQLRASIFLHN